MTATAMPTRPPTIDDTPPPPAGTDRPRSRLLRSDPGRTWRRMPPIARWAIAALVAAPFALAAYTRLSSAPDAVVRNQELNRQIDEAAAVINQLQDKVAQLEASGVGQCPNIDFLSDWAADFGGLSDDALYKLRGDQNDPDGYCIRYDIFKSAMALWRTADVCPWALATRAGTGKQQGAFTVDIDPDGVPHGLPPMLHGCQAPR